MDDVFKIIGFIIWSVIIYLLTLGLIDGIKASILRRRIEREHGINTKTKI